MIRLITIALLAALGSGCDSAPVAGTADATATTASAPAPGSASPVEALPHRFVCRGNEPGWRLDIDGETAVWTALSYEGTVTTELQGDYHKQQFRPLVFHWRGREVDAGQETRDLVAFISPAQCSDTMADRQYPYRALLSSADGNILNGCCEMP